MTHYHIRHGGVDVATTAKRTSWLEFNVPFQHKYGYIRDESKENIHAFEMWCYRRALRISYVEHVSNDEVLSRMSQSRKLLSRVRSRKLKYFGHVARHPSMEKDIMLGPMPGTRRQGGQRRQWLDDITDWAEIELPRMVQLAGDRREFRSFVHSIIQAPHGV